MKNNLLILCNVVMAFLTIGCGRQESGPSDRDIEFPDSEGIVLDVYLADENLLVSIKNGSKEVVSLVDEPLIGFGATGPRVGLVLQKNGKDVLPCGHLDPPLQEDPPTHLIPGNSEMRTINLRVLRKAYCLEAGAYTVRAIYPADSPSPDSSSVVSLVFEKKAKAPSL